MLVFKIPGRKRWDELVQFPRTKLFNFSLRREEQIQIFSVYLGFLPRICEMKPNHLAVTAEICHARKKLCSQSG